MKIMIKFEQREKETLMGMALNCGGAKEIVDKDEHIVGNFGEFKYNHEENEMIIDFKSSFVKAAAHLTVIIINTIKSFISTCDMFSESWFSDTKDLLAEEAKQEKESEPVGDREHVPTNFVDEVQKELNK